jgi:hypothetical protein
MGLNGHFACCGICGALGHRTRACPLFRLEELKAKATPRDDPPARRTVRPPERAMLISGARRV